MYTIVSNLVSSVKDYLKTKEYINFKETNNIYIYANCDYFENKYKL